MRWLLLISTLLQASPAQVRIVLETELGSITVEVDAARAHLLDDGSTVLSS